MGLLQLDTTAEVLAGLGDLPELYLIRPTVLDLGVGRYRISAYGPEELIPELEARGCTVRVLMTTAEIEQFHQRVAETVLTPQERLANRPPEADGHDAPET
jgi:hypothetical protein